MTEIPSSREGQAKKIWLLVLVPEGRHGRWLAAIAILTFGAVVFGVAAWLVATYPRRYANQFSPTVAAFFVAGVAYVVPVFHYITERTREALDSLAHRLAAQTLAHARHSLTHKPPMWGLRSILAGICLWLVQSRLLAGSWSYMLESVSRGYVAIVMDFGPLPVWLVMTAATRALAENAMSFRRIAQEVRADVFSPPTFAPVGAMAVTSTLFILGALAVLPIMWLGGPISWWTTLPALLMFLPMIPLLLLLPIWPLHRRLVQQRQRALAEAQEAIDQARQGALDDPAGPNAELANALALRREVVRLPVWPLDIGAVTRFLAYAVIVPLTWAGAALIEMLVNTIVGA
ncbi:MAG: hypothetical protein AAGA68_24235 [Pseudomonadota bacterium]